MALKSTGNFIFKGLNMISKHNHLDTIKKEALDTAIESGYDIDTTRYSKALDWLFDEKNKQAVLYNLRVGSSFDYPDYFDLPKMISSKLTGDEVDLLQELVSYQLAQFYESEVSTQENLSSSINQNQYHQQKKAK
jgi:hypothetical protein